VTWTLSANFVALGGARHGLEHLVRREAIVRSKSKNAGGDGGTWPTAISEHDDLLALSERRFGPAPSPTTSTSVTSKFVMKGPPIGGWRQFIKLRARLKNRNIVSSLA
jgi:hypothetical protein